MENKTCGECALFIPDLMSRCGILGVGLRDVNAPACKSFLAKQEPKKPTIGDRIRKMSNEGVAAFVCGVLNDRRQETFRSVLDLLNAPAESYVEDENELKPCPFCGSDDLSVHLDDGFSYYVWCGNCGSQTDNNHLTEKEAIEAWNNRPAEDALKAEVEHLKADFDAQKSVSKIAYNDIKWLCKEVEKWKKMFYDLDDKLANTPEKGGDDE